MQLNWTTMHAKFHSWFFNYIIDHNNLSFFSLLLLLNTSNVYSLVPLHVDFCRQRNNIMYIRLFNLSGLEAYYVFYKHFFSHFSIASRQWENWIELRTKGNKVAKQQVDHCQREFFDEDNRLTRRFASIGLMRKYWVWMRFTLPLSIFCWEPKTYAHRSVEHSDRATAPISVRVDRSYSERMKVKSTCCIDICRQQRTREQERLGGKRAWQL